MATPPPSPPTGAPAGKARTGTLWAGVLGGLLTTAVESVIAAIGTALLFVRAVLGSAVMPTASSSRVPADTIAFVLGITGFLMALAAAFIGFLATRHARENGLGAGPVVTLAMTNALTLPFAMAVLGALGPAGRDGRGAVLVFLMVLPLVGLAAGAAWGNRPDRGAGA